MENLVPKIANVIGLRDDEHDLLSVFPKRVLESVWQSFVKNEANIHYPRVWFLRSCERCLKEKPYLAQKEKTEPKPGPRPLIEVSQPTPETRTAEQIAGFVQNRMLDPEMIKLQQTNPGLYDVLLKMGKAVFDRQLEKEMAESRV